MQYIVPILTGYFLGSISFSFLMGKLLKGIDVRQHGSGNAGATNTMRVLGLGPAIIVLALDILKGIASVWIARWIAPDDLWIHAAAGLAVIAGHNWPVFFRFKGGKGIASTIGVMATLCFFPALYTGIIAVLSIFFTRWVSLGSLIFTGTLPIAIWLMDRPLEILIASLFVTCFAFYRHRSNIVRIAKGQENKLGARRKQG